jgi:hypothetical protein
VGSYELRFGPTADCALHFTMTNLTGIDKSLFGLEEWTLSLR